MMRTPTDEDYRWAVDGMKKAAMDANRRFAELCGYDICPIGNSYFTDDGDVADIPDYAADPRLVLREINPADMEDFVNFLLDGCSASEQETYGPTTIDCCLYLCDLFKDTTGQLRDRAIEWLTKHK